MKECEVVVRMYYPVVRVNRNYDVVTFSIIVQAANFQDAVDKANDRLLPEGSINFEIVQVNVNVER